MKENKKNSELAGNQQVDTKFKKGKSGNPSGRSIGSRNKATLLAMQLTDSEIKKVRDSVIKAAINGDMTAAKIILERLAPKYRAELPLIELQDFPYDLSASDKINYLVSQVSSGVISATIADTLATLIQSSLKAEEIEELADEIESIKTILKNR